MNIAEITNGFDRPQEVMSNLEDSQMESELFQSLKLHIDSQSKLIQLYQSRIRSYERFHKYCQRVAQHGDGTTEERFDLGQFQNEYNRFDKNYRYFRMKIRKLRKEMKSSLSTRYQDPYDALHELFTKIESLEKSTNTKISIDQSINNCLSQEKKPEDRPLSVVPISYQTPILILNPIRVNNLSVDTTEHIESHFKCFVDGCDQTFSSKSLYLDHLYEHSLSVGQIPTSMANKRAKAIKTKARERIATQQTRSATASTSKVRNRCRKRQTSIATDQKPANKLPNSEIVSENDTQSQNNSLGKNKPPTLFKCDFFGCQYEYFERYDLKRHQMRHSDIRPFKCDFFGCQYECFERYDLKRHQAKHSNIRPFKCDFFGCQYECFERYDLKRHKLKHSDLRPFKCDQCEKTFKVKNAVIAHRVSVHERRRFPCTEEGCSASLSSKNCLLKHINTYHCKDPNVYRCEGEGCDYKTTNVDALKRHSAIHSEDRPFKCMWPDCGKAFKTYTTRQAHILMHKNERRFKCKYPDCSFACNTTNNLRKHHLVHEKKEARQNGQN